MTNEQMQQEIDRLKEVCQQHALEKVEMGRQITQLKASKHSGNFEEWADDYCLPDGETRQDCFFAWQAATAKATLAERERCALIIEGYPNWLGRAAKKEISVSIRGLLLPPTGTGGNHG